MGFIKNKITFILISIIVILISTGMVYIKYSRRTISSLHDEVQTQVQKTKEAKRSGVIAAFEAKNKVLRTQFNKVGGATNEDFIIHTSDGNYTYHFK